MEKVYENIFLEEVVLKNSPLKYLNFYIIKGSKKSIIIDTGFNDEDAKEQILELFRRHGIQGENTILFLTHLHSDHTGLASFFSEMGLTVYASKVDGDLVNASLEKQDPMWLNTVLQGHMQGLDIDNLDIEDHPGYKFRPTEFINYKEAKPGDIISTGEFNFEVVDLKGHTPGIVGLYEREHKLLFCGDHILGKITPNITFWGFDYGDILGIYLNSLDYVYSLEIDHLFSSHRHLVPDHRERIRELKTHHRCRLHEAIAALKKTERATVREVTKQLHWDIRAKSWDDFPSSQKWFAAGEAHAHLEHLRHSGLISMEIENGILYYKMK